MHHECVASTLSVNTVPLSVKTRVTPCDKCVELGRLECACMLRQPRVGSTWLTSLSQVKRPDRFFKTAYNIILAGCQISSLWMMVQSFPAEIPHFFRVCCSVCGRALLRSGITPSLRPGHFHWTPKSCNSTDYQTRTVFQIGHHVELRQLCCFCACASNHVTVNARDLCRTYQQHLKYQSVRRT
jgi:hypothetical protein